VLKNKTLALNKPFNVVLIALMFSGLILGAIGVVHADSSIPKPSVPEFTVKIVSYPYDVPPTTTTTVDPYTGKETVTTQPGYRVENKSIELIIKNQPFTPHTDTAGHMIDLYYNVRVKGHFAEECYWRELYSIDEMMREGSGARHQGPAQSNSEYTVISCPADYPDDGKVDFQVQALAGYYTEWWPFALVPIMAWHFTGQLSEWSNTQTICISDGTVTVSTSLNPTETPTPTNTPTLQSDSSPTPNNGSPNEFLSENMQLTIIATTVAVLAAVIASLLLYIKRLKSK
jgi:hypothetical protein